MAFDDVTRQKIADLAAWLLDTYKQRGVILWLEAFVNASEADQRTLLLRASIDPMGG